MSSLIPKIKLGVDTHTGHFDLSSMTHATSEIGYVMPTYSKYIVPKSKVSIGTRTGSRLSPLFVPTMGQIEIRHYHCFIPFNTIWFPFDAFLTKTNYTLPDGTTYIPTDCPYFKVGYLLRHLFGANASSDVSLRKYLSSSIYDDNGVQLSSSQIDALDIDGLRGIFGSSSLNCLPKYLISSDGVQYMIVDVDSGYDLIKLTDNAKVSDVSFPSMAHCDFSDVSSDASQTLCYNFNGPIKRLRSIFMGLGYSFNPYDLEKVTPFKLLAFYKSYWSLFGVNRSYNFFNTYCYKLIKVLSESTQRNMNIVGNIYTLFINFISVELTKCTYTCPADYFSASDTITGRGAENGLHFSSLIAGDTGSGYTQTTAGAAADQQTAHTVGFGGNAAESALGQKIALRMLRFVNKNSVIGRQIAEILRARYGVSDIHNALHENVDRVGASKTPINIQAVYNNTDAGDMPLGSYAGLGVSGPNGAISKKFTFETKEFGTLITLTAVVPKMGYFQGMFRENSDGVIDNTEFYTPEFDAIAWQSVRYNELIADRQFKSILGGSTTPDATTQLGNFGYNPTYQHYKVSFNRALGDISLPSMQESMLPYTLDRYFKNKQLDNYPISQIGIPDLPPNEPMYFRSGTRGETNRIFSDMSPTEDHVIMQIFFDIKMTAPMKSIANSYDTIDEESTHTTEVGHE